MSISETSPYSWYYSYATGEITKECKKLFADKAGIPVFENHIEGFTKIVDAAINYSHNFRDAVKSPYPSAENSVRFVKYFWKQQKEISDCRLGEGSQIIAVMIGGSNVALLNRFEALLQAIKVNKLNVTELRVHARENEREKNESFLKQLCMMHGINIPIIIKCPVKTPETDFTKNSLMQDLEAMKGQTYILCSDPRMVNRIEAIARSVLDSVSALCGGIFSKPVRSGHIPDYLFDTALGKVSDNPEKLLEMASTKRVPEDVVVTQEDIRENGQLILWFESKTLHEASQEYSQKKN